MNKEEIIDRSAFFKIPLYNEGFVWQALDHCGKFALEMRVAKNVYGTCVVKGQKSMSYLYKERNDA